MQGELMTSLNWKLRDLYNLICNSDDAYLRSLHEGPNWGNDYRPLLENDRRADPSGLVVQQSLALWDEWEWTAQLHKFVAVDSREPFHTHQATVGFRYILLGGYDEEVIVGSGDSLRIELKQWRKGMCGFIHHNYNHRIIGIQPEGAMSLWIRGPTKHNVTWRYPSGAVRTLDIEGREIAI